MIRIWWGVTLPILIIILSENGMVVKSWVALKLKINFNNNNDDDDDYDNNEKLTFFFIIEECSIQWTPVYLFFLL